jgi:hypothetical protein
VRIATSRIKIPAVAYHPNPEAGLSAVIIFGEILSTVSIAPSIEFADPRANIILEAFSMISSKISFAESLTT